MGTADIKAWLYGCRGLSYRSSALANLHDAAEVHDRHAVADVLHHAQVVGDEQVGKVHLFLELGQQVDDLRLDGHVQGRDRFVADDDQRIQGQRPGDADALALAARKLVGIPVHVRRVQADTLHELRHPLSDFVPREVQVVADRFGDDVAHGHARVQRGKRVLENDLQRGPDPPHLPGSSSRRLCPSKITRPAVGSISRSRQRPTVVLPQPLSPTSPKVSPGSG